MAEESTNVSFIEVGNLKMESHVYEEVSKLSRAHSAANEGMVLSIDLGSNRLFIQAHEKDITFTDLCDEHVPETSPRYIIYSYKWVRDDGRVQYPMVFVYYNPEGCRPDYNVLYSRHASQVQGNLKIPRLFTIQNHDDLNEEWLVKNLKASVTR
eukprot:TRINITY_DN1759_c0_g1::TRINITY_DN1759_c0_g1_i1::g.25264::m.25264 TRINITY_DN1759_c0_g1::TRINITY_DN1759_c0_g1_i1::g.25264  ORF type:complete len:171 (+),score=39.15,sp/Q5R6P6/GMFB_PONAB/32.54/6e-22,Cofilin_ADF/PF00241.15/4.5e-11,PGK/PF00162.14/0.048 TRINITY_DN1759_c0_g1_i1:52-513(+)